MVRLGWLLVLVRGSFLIVWVDQGRGAGWAGRGLVEFVGGVRSVGFDKAPGSLMVAVASSGGVGGDAELLGDVGPGLVLVAGVGDGVGE